VRIRRSADCRYEGQSFELTVPVAAPGRAQHAGRAGRSVRPRARADVRHRAGPDEPVEIVSLRVVGQGIPDRPRVPDVLRVDRSGRAARADRAACTSARSRWRETPIIDRGDLVSRSARVPGAAPSVGPGSLRGVAPFARRAGGHVGAPHGIGPCIVEEYDATCVVPPGARPRWMGMATSSSSWRPRERDLMESVRDPIAFELFRNTLLSIADEMALTILRTAYSGVLRDNMDYSTAFCDGQGRTVRRASPCPHLSSFPMPWPRRSRLRRPHEAGDVYCLNDPFEGGMHIPDVFVLKPISSRANGWPSRPPSPSDRHGRPVAGSNASTRPRLPEGLRIPPVKMYDQVSPTRRSSALREERAHARRVLGDIRAQLSPANRRGGVPPPRAPSGAKQ